MSAAVSGVAKLVRDARAAVSHARVRAHLANAWVLLHQRDADGNLSNPLPYTEAARHEFQAALDHDPEDVRVLHHLAIAHHARAWDLELQDKPKAAQEAWTDALGYWYRVARSAPFWAALERKLRLCDPQADLAGLTVVKQDLLEHLLDVHVDFVRHYCESDAHDRAARHVNIINAALIPPALRRRLIAKVFAAMTGAIPDAKEQRAFGSALTTLERFLSLFSQHLPALTLHAELCTAWVCDLSYKADWDVIMEASRRAQPFAQQLEAHADLDEDHLARAALDDLATELTQRGYDRTHAYLNDREYRDLSSSDRKELQTGLDLGIAWGRLAHRRSPSGSRLRGSYVICLLNRGYFLHQEALEVLQSDVDELTKTAACVSLLRQAVAESEEGLACAPGHEGLTRNLLVLRRELATCESQLAGLKNQEDHRLADGMG